MNYHRNAFAKSALRLLVSQRRPFTRSYAALIRFRTRLPESHLQKSFQTCTGRPQLLRPPSPENAVEDSISHWKEFYTRARALLNKGSHATVEDTMEIEEPYGFPKDGDPALDTACEALSEALQNASKAEVKQDTPEVKQALDNLRKAYDEAAKANTVMVRYVDVEPPPSPWSPLSPLTGGRLERILLARPWMKEVIRGLSDQSLPRRLVVIGNPGSGKSFALVGYLLFYLIARGARVILQSETPVGNLGYVFDDDGVHEVSRHDAFNYDDGRPCYLLVSADGTQIYPSPVLNFCHRIIVVTSPNMKSKLDLKNWKKQAEAEQFVAPPPSHLEVVYLLSQTEKFDSFIVYWMYREWTRDFRRCRRDCRDAISQIKEGTLFEWYETKTQEIKSFARKMLSGGQELDNVNQLSDSETNLAIPSNLVTMERHRGKTRQYDIIFMTARIAKIIVDVQEERNWAYSWETLNMFFRNPETRVAAGSQFQKMFLRKFRTQDPNTMPPCYELGKTTGMHPLSPLRKNAEAVMPWKDIGQQPTLEWISVGKDADGSLYSEKELRAVMDAVMDKDSPPIRFVIPCAQNWATWDAALFLRSEKEEKRELHIVFLQTIIRPDHGIYAKGLNLVRDAIPKNGKGGEGFSVHYHYVLVLMTCNEPISRIPKWRHVLLDSNEQKKDTSWRRDNLRQYIMYVPLKELLQPSSKD